MDKKWDRLSEEQRRKVIDELILFFENERDEKIGVVAAEQILNFFLQTAGNKLYKKGVEDAIATIEKRLEDIRYDFDDLLDFS